MISPDNTPLLFSVVVFLAGAAFVIEKRTQFGKKISGVVIAMFSMMLLANVSVVPMSAPSYDFVFTWIIPVAIPMFLFKANLIAIFRETGKTLIAFILGGFGTAIGAVFMYFILGKGESMLKAMGLFTATYVGGTVNFVAIAEILKLDGDVLASAVAADNVVMALVLIFLFMLPASKYAQRFFPFKDEDYSEEGVGNDDNNGSFSATDFVYSFSIAFIIAGLSMVVAPLISKELPHILVSTVVTVALATAFPGFFGKIKGSEEMGIFLMYLFFAVVGASANFMVILEKGLILFVFASGTIIIHLLVILFGGKLFGIPLPEILVASNANIGGPTTACGMAMAKRWDKLIVPAVLVGLLGYVTATFAGTLLYKLFS